MKPVRRAIQTQLEPRQADGLRLDLTFTRIENVVWGAVRHALGLEWVHR